jgi:hypothetical protein
MESSSTRAGTWCAGLVARHIGARWVAPSQARRRCRSMQRVTGITIVCTSLDVHAISPTIRASFDGSGIVKPNCGRGEPLMPGSGGRDGARTITPTGK